MGQIVNWCIKAIPKSEMSEGGGKEGAHPLLEKVPKGEVGGGLGKKLCRLVKVIPEGEMSDGEREGAEWQRLVETVSKREVGEGGEVEEWERGIDMVGEGDVG